jgi:hypothetical protein
MVPLTFTILFLLVLPLIILVLLLLLLLLILLLLLWTLCQLSMKLRQSDQKHFIFVFHISANVSYVWITGWQCGLIC